MAIAKHAPTFKPTLVTPEIARQLLQRNTDNRRVARTRVLMHIARIRLGNWKMTHQGVAVANTGRLLDGQHRLLAIVETEMPQWLVVSKGWDEGIYDAIDGGASRTMADRTQLNKRIAEEASMICRIANGFKYETIVESAVMLVAEAFSPEIDLLHDTCNSTAKARSTQTSRTAAILRIAHDGDDYAAQEFRKFVLLHQDMSRIAWTMNKQLSFGMAAHKAPARDLCARYWKVWDKEQAHLTTLQINDPTKQIDEMRKVIIDRMGALSQWLKPNDEAQSVKQRPMRRTNSANHEMSL